MTSASSSRSASLSAETREMLRTLGTIALKLAEEGIDDPERLRSQFNGSAVAVTQPNTPSDLLTIPEACGRLRLSRWSVYQLIHRRELGSVKIGRRRFVPLAEAERFVAGLTDAGGRS